MDFVDWRKRREQSIKDAEEQQKHSRIRGRVGSYIEEMIRDAQARGEFDNLAGTGKPLNLNVDRSAGDNSMAYGILKNSNHLPYEIEVSKKIDSDLARANTRIERVRHLSHTLRKRTFSLSQREKRNFNTERDKALAEYEQTLRAINSKILTLNLTAPPAMHRSLLEVGKLVQQFADECPSLV